MTTDNRRSASTDEIPRADPIVESGKMYNRVYVVVVVCDCGICAVSRNFLLAQTMGLMCADMRTFTTTTRLWLCVVGLVPDSELKVVAFHQDSFGIALK